MTIYLNENNQREPIISVIFKDTGNIANYALSALDSIITKLSQDSIVIIEIKPLQYHSWISYDVTKLNDWLFVREFIENNDIKQIKIECLNEAPNGFKISN